MATGQASATTLAQAAAQALRRGDPRGARELFRQATASGQANAAAWLGLAYACHVLEDHVGADGALERALALEPRNPGALLLRADRLAAAGDHRAASSFYLAVVKSAAPAEHLPADLAAGVRRAEEACRRYAQEHEAGLRARLAARGFDPARSSRRFAESLDILFGHRRIYVQEPRYFYFPGLPQQQFYERDGFPWMDTLEAATADIREELLEVMRAPDAFAPYVQSDPARPRKSQDGMLDNPDWSAFYLWKNGEPVAGNVERCPRTMAALADAPLARISSRSPSVLFSLLRPGARIPPHNGLVNTRLICHLPLIVPGRCRFRVGNEQREWIEGRAWAFDDSIEHEAWNDSNGTRVILLFDIWRPELREDERALVMGLFEAIDAQSGARPDWEI